ncbi:MAG: addiction module antidote protein, HigA family [Lachnospiraceae bacterium]|nr:addiction module antidote protein, HigA family [Lachnospiraceae bacterium]
MSNIKEYKDIIAVHPGYYIADLIEELGMTQAEFATRVGTNTKTISYLVNGQANITNDLAKKMSVMTGTSEVLWLNLQSSYDQKVIEIQKEKDFDEQKDLARLIDYEFFIDVVELPTTKSIGERILNLCKYFKVSDLRIMMNQDFLVNYRKGVSSVSDKNIINSRAWVQTAINFSQGIETKSYDAEKLKSYLSEIRSMTLQKPELFLPRMKQIFSECGVAFVLLPNLKNSGVNGAVKWIGDDRAVLAMNNRRLDADIFWFSLFHEVRHVLQRKVKTTFISYTDEEMIEENERLEKDADNFAMNYLIPPVAMRKFAPTKYTTDEEIIGFAKSIGIHPGIVAGRLQHDGVISHKRCSKLKEKYYFVMDKYA